MVIRMPGYDAKEMADNVAQHAFKHVEEGRFSGRGEGEYGPDLGIKTMSDLSAHIERTILDPNTYVSLGIDKLSRQETRDVYINQGTNTSVIINTDTGSGTCYRASLKDKSELERLYRRDSELRERHGLAPPQPFQPGGYNGLYPSPFQEQSSGGIDERSADYFSKAVDDPDRYPALDSRMDDLIQTRRQEEAIDNAFAKREGRETNQSVEARTALMQERAEYYVEQQKTQQQGI